MTNNKLIINFPDDYLPFLELASNEDIGAFIKAQLSKIKSEELPELTGMAKALYLGYNQINVNK